ncbi:hypothetical protein S40293_06723 [Stachybotrys chartarum IBT 40293]|nr:hypothetical protein S40293_06723 [Stachybotrys chartarum IBT 40293]
MSHDGHQSLDRAGAASNPKHTRSSSCELKSPASKRSQVPRACERCKRLRRGCSEYRPCRRCVDAGLRDQCHGGGSPLQVVHSPTNGSGSNYQRLAALLPSHVLEHCSRRFFETLHPTIPVLTDQYLTRLRSVALYAETGIESLCVLVAMCAQVLLQAEEPQGLLEVDDGVETKAAYGRLLLEAARSVQRTLPARLPPSIEVCLFTFFLYACETSLSHHSQAFRCLREATTMLMLFRPPEADEVVQLVHARLFWVLLISERSHAIRYRRPLTLSICHDTPKLRLADPALAGFSSLAALFTPVDTSFVAMLNQEIMLMPPSASGLDSIEAAVNAALSPGIALHDTQKANLRVTQLWLRIIIWQLRLRLGWLVEESLRPSQTFRFPMEVAKDLMLSTRDLPLSSLIVHGVGLTEKMFDIASTLIDVLARVPATPTTAMVFTDSRHQHLAYIRSIIVRLPGGTTIYDDLLEKHIQQALPDQAS